MSFSITNQLFLQAIYLNLAEEDAAKKLRYQEKLKEYMTRAEQIKELYKSQISKGEIVDKRHIIENSTGNSYETIFGKYLKDDVKEISLDEPYIREHYQVSHTSLISRI